MTPEKSRKRLKLSNDQEVELSVIAYLNSPERGDFRLLHDCRKKPDDPRYVPLEKAELLFMNWCKGQSPLFCSTRHLQFDAVVVAPSSKNFANYLFDHTDLQSNNNVSNRFTKKDGFRSGEDDPSLTDVFEAIQYRAAGDEDTIRSIAIFDDVVSDKGKTVAAIVQRMQEAGMGGDVEITIFCAHHCVGRTMTQIIREITGD